MDVLKENTKSICPNCFKEISAKVIEENEQVYLTKECVEHGKFKVLIEKSPWLYKKLMNTEFLEKKTSFRRLLFPITHLCNLSCNQCYLPKRDNYNFPLEDMERIISSFDYKRVTLSGGEPTLREDLPDVIERITRNCKDVILPTNGLRLTNINYLKRLKNSGLKSINFSFNGFNEKIYEKINGQKLLKIKLKALRNIKKAKIPTTLSIMLVRGINENEIKKIYRYCLKNNSFIKQFRIRSSVYVGRHIEKECFYLSEILKMFSKVIGVSEEKLVAHSLEKGMYYSEYNINPMPCHLEIDLFSLLMDEVGIETRANPLLKKIKAVFKILPKVGLKNLFKMFLRKLMKKEPLIEFKIYLRSWPDKYRIDLSEIQRCPSGHVTADAKNILPFCYALILNEKNSIL